MKLELSTHAVDALAHALNAGITSFTNALQELQIAVSAANESVQEEAVPRTIQTGNAEDGSKSAV